MDKTIVYVDESNIISKEELDYFINEIKKILKEIGEGELDIHWQ